MAKGTPKVIQSIIEISIPYVSCINALKTIFGAVPTRVDIPPIVAAYAIPSIKDVSKYVISFSVKPGIVLLTTEHTANPIGNSIRVVEVFITNILIKAAIVIKPAINFGPLDPAAMIICRAILLFMIPSTSNKGELLDWGDSDKLPWGLLILFGGGLSIAAQINSSGLGIWIGEGLSVLSTVPPIFLILAVAALIIFLTEVTSNVATTSTFLPVFGAVAVGIGVLPVSLTVPVCLAASCAFMLPVATPPNAIVYGSGKFTIATMIKAVFALNIIGIVVVTLFAYYLAPLIF